jgi:ferredoxin/flavodoxin
MNMTKKEAFIIYCSPAGTTRHVGDVIAKCLESEGMKVTRLALGTKEDPTPILARIREAGENGTLFIGSPVYVFHALPQVMEFIELLPQSTGACAIPFITWGGVSSGVALHEMGTLLDTKGYKVAGGAKVLAVHSMMRDATHPLGEGRPDSDDDRMIVELTKTVHKKLGCDKVEGIDLDDLAYQPESLGQMMTQASIKGNKARMPEKRIDEERCVQCETCMALCPAGAITLSPYPRFTDECIFCYNCTTVCPEDAIIADLSQIPPMLRKSAEELSEKPFSNIFL